MSVLRLERNRWHRLGRPVTINEAVAVIGENYDAADELDLGLVDVGARRRSVLTFSDGRWRRHRSLEGIGGGPMPTGPVRRGSRVFLPVVDATVSPWQFSAYVLDDERWSPPGAALNQGTGNAQGVLRVSGGSVWAAWQEHDPRADGLFDTRMYVRRLAPAGREAEAIWAGPTIGPGDIETIRGAGALWVLYMPGRTGQRELTVRVKRLRP